MSYVPSKVKVSVGNNIFSKIKENIQLFVYFVLNQLTIEITFFNPLSMCKNGI